MDALDFAYEAHKGQTRSNGEPYIHHPIRVAAYSELYIKDHSKDLVRAVALLHDVIEDCEVTEDDIRRLFGSQVALYITELTNYYVKDFYPDSRKRRKTLEIDRLSKCSLLAKQIKLIDRFDNLTRSKISTKVTYLEESELLLNKLGDANQQVALLLKAKIDSFKGR